MAKEKEEEKLVTNPYFYNYRNRPPQVKICSKKPSKVQESPLDAKSPQELLEKYGMYRDSSSLDTVRPFYADLTQFQSFEDTCNHVRDIKEKFMQLDVDIRAKFNHNPEEFCNYITSSDFDIKEIMNASQYQEYKTKIDEEKAEKEYQKYINSAEYKKNLAEQEQFKAYQQKQYEEWKKQFGGSN